MCSVEMDMNEVLLKLLFEDMQENNELSESKN